MPEDSSIAQSVAAKALKAPLRPGGKHPVQPLIFSPESVYSLKKRDIIEKQ